MKILFVYSNETDPCTRIQCFELSKGLKQYAETTEIYYSELNEEKIIYYDTIIFQRIGANGVSIEDKYCEEILKLIEKYKKTKNFVYLIDDLVIEDQNGLPKQFIRLCNGTICPNHIMKQHLLHYNKHIHVLRTYIDMDVVEKVKKKKIDGFYVAWVSTAGLGLGLVEDVINNIRKELDIKFVYMGGGYQLLKAIDGLEINPYLPNEEMLSYLKGCRMIINPMVPYEDYKNRLEKRTKINIKEFLDCKSEIKYVLAGATKTAFISSKTAANMYAVKNGWNGILVNDTVEEWINAIKKLYYDEELREKIIENAYIDVNKQYTLNYAAESAYKILMDINEKK